MRMIDSSLACDGQLSSWNCSLVIKSTEHLQESGLGDLKSYWSVIVEAVGAFPWVYLIFIMCMHANQSFR